MRAALHYPFLLLLLWACVPAQQETLPTPPETIFTADRVVDTALMYHSAIGEYISAMTERDGSFADTLYINRHEDFPDIGLPAIIAGTSIRVLTPAEAETVKGGERFVCLNIFGWFTGHQVEFLVVNFKQGMRHWPDGRDDRRLYYSIGSGQKEIALDSLRF